ncbi:SEL1-like repeat protein [Aquimarina pacifica]|uniref:sel1 repeat family protein n=1 Tax=Aquimarina pacifica TaxID=1296415 RepID=UPI0004725B61|nr:sel1 repeat family protein [Aquimarina pacifica]
MKIKKLLIIASFVSLSSCAQQSIEDLKKKSENGDLESRFELAQMYLDSSGSHYKRDSGMLLLKDLADIDHPKAQHLYGVQLLSGKDGLLPQNQKMGFEYITKSSDNIYPPAKIDKGLCHYFAFRRNNADVIKGIAAMESGLRNELKDDNGMISPLYIEKVLNLAKENSVLLKSLATEKKEQFLRGFYTKNTFNEKKVNHAMSLFGKKASKESDKLGNTTFKKNEEKADLIMTLIQNKKYKQLFALGDTKFKEKYVSAEAFSRFLESMTVYYGDLLYPIYLGSSKSESTSIKDGKITKSSKVFLRLGLDFQKINCELKLELKGNSDPVILRGFDVKINSIVADAIFDPTINEIDSLISVGNYKQIYSLSSSEIKSYYTEDDFISALSGYNNVSLKERKIISLDINMVEGTVIHSVSYKLVESSIYMKLLFSTSSEKGNYTIEGISFSKDKL